MRGLRSRMACIRSGVEPLRRFTGLLLDRCVWQSARWVSPNFVLSDGEDNAYFHEWLKVGAQRAILLRAYCEPIPTASCMGSGWGRTTSSWAHFKAYDKAAKYVDHF